MCCTESFSGGTEAIANPRQKVGQARIARPAALRIENTLVKRKNGFGLP